MRPRHKAAALRGGPGHDREDTGCHEGVGSALRGSPAGGGGIYDRRAAIYDPFVSFSTLGLDMRYRRAMARLLDPASGLGFVLDLGGGTGRSVRPLIEAGARKVIVQDNSAGMISRAEGASKIRADALRLPYAGGSFDRVLAAYLLTSIMDPTGVLDEIFRVLEPRGRLVVADDRLPQGWFSGFGVMLRRLREEGYRDYLPEVLEWFRERMIDVDLERRHLGLIFIVRGTKPG